MKMKPRTFLIIAVLVVLIAFVAANWDQIKAAIIKQQGGSSSGGSTGTGGSSGTGAAPSASNPITPAPLVGTRNYDKVLKKGTVTILTGEVKELQTLLNNINSYKKLVGAQLATDNNFGTKTEEMLRTYAGVTQITLNQAYAAYQKAIGL